MNPSARPPLPIVGLIGPTNIARVSAAAGIPAAVYRENAIAAGQAIAAAGAAIALVPDRGVAVHGLHGYRKGGGAWVVGLQPQGGPADPEATPNCFENSQFCHEILGGFTWHHQHALLCDISDLFVCVGLSCGTIAEIAWTKWVKRPPILALAATITAIPAEISAEIQVSLIEAEENLEMAIRRRLCATHPPAPGHVARTTRAKTASEPK